MQIIIVLGKYKKFCGTIQKISHSFLRNSNLSPYISHRIGNVICQLFSEMNFCWAMMRERSEWAASFFIMTVRAAKNAASHSLSSPLCDGGRDEARAD